MTEFSEWAEKMNLKFEKEIRIPEANSIDIDKEKVFAKTLKFDTGLFTFEIHVKLLPRDRRLVRKLQSIDDPTDYDKIQDVMAELLSSLCENKEMDKEFWISYDEETGELPYIFGAISTEIQKIEESAVNFREE